jgi:NACalpha-BTF3-like transcription factor
MSKEKKQKEKQYIIRNPGIVMKRFYDGFNHKFLYAKAQTLMFLVSQQERLKEMVKQVEETSDESTTAYLSSHY